jgi:formylglycine-generating enzyme required for sulfatase activity
MKRISILLFVGLLFLVACTQAAPTLTPEQVVVSTASATVKAVTATHTPTAVPSTHTPTPTFTPTPSATAIQTASPTPTPTEVPAEIDQAGFSMVYVPESYIRLGAVARDLWEECNTFRSGCQPDWFYPVEPQHSVWVSSFYIDRHEVTNDAYVVFLNELGDHQASCLNEDCLGTTLDDSQIRLGDENTYEVKAGFGDHPVTGVTWYGAAAFCQWRDSRLPTEAEWEKAASWNPETRRKTLYPWGNTFDGTAVNFCDVKCTQSQADGSFNDGFSRTSVVGTYEAGRSPVGAYDLAGNVWEWVSDWYDPQYYAISPSNNPQGPDSGEQRVVRGGSWFDTGNFLNSAFRSGVDPTISDDTIGFRCATD